MPRVLLSVLLICAALAPFVPQRVSSQTVTATETTHYSTATSFTTEYSTTYSTATATEAIHYEHRPDNYDYATGSFTLGESEEKPLRTLFVPITPLLIRDTVTCLYYDYFVLHGAASQEIRGHFEAPSPVNFYVMSVDQLISFYGYYCGYYAPPAEVKAFTSSYDLDWIVPKDGAYAILFTSHRPYVGHLTFYFTAYTQSTATQTATASYTVTGAQVFQNVETILSSQVKTGTPQNTSEGLILAALVVFVLIMGFSVIAIKTKRTRSNR